VRFKADVEVVERQGIPLTHQEAAGGRRGVREGRGRIADWVDQGGDGWGSQELGARRG
jgi:hypothetical protein